jgi:CRISPR-associated protein Cas2
MRQLYLISYDIRDSARRTRVMQSIKGNAVGGQKSVYECWLDDSELTHARHALEDLIDQDIDRVFITGLDPRAAIHTLGMGTPPEDGDMFYLG